MRLRKAGPLSIAPFWNWNSCRRWLPASAATLNRTILELKFTKPALSRSMLYSQSHHFGIEIGNTRRKSDSKRLSIAPFWNWNRLAGRLFPFPVSLSIAPFWNWNEVAAWFPSVSFVSQSHHFGIEMLAEGSGITLTTTLSIAPFWNWNQQIRPFAYPLLLSQSHHFGIEIYAAKPAFLRWGNSQSHHFGIEICCGAKLRNAIPSSQSHHFGIEINYKENP